MWFLRLQARAVTVLWYEAQRLTGSSGRPTGVRRRVRGGYRGVVFEDNSPRKSCDLSSGRWKCFIATPWAEAPLVTSHAGWLKRLEGVI
ncbi:hypothetical protein M885DRAFT_119550 [Pelagophyceae sp. CCMP2097]|nr:hypothetical protein M885DRAFT_119550 [Pelagophyceae sp. CCMP2097]